MPITDEDYFEKIKKIDVLADELETEITASMQTLSLIHILIQQFKETGDCKTFFDQLMPIDQCNQLLGIRDWNPSGMF